MGDFRHSGGESHRWARIRRRLVTVPAVLVGLVLGWALVIPALLVGLVLDLVNRRPASTARVVLYGLWWLSVEAIGIVVAGVLWLRYAPTGGVIGIDARKAHSHVQHWWTKCLVGGARALLGLRYSVQGINDLAGEGPLVVLARHGSQGDALLVASVLAQASFRSRFVVKRQLLWDPCLDLYGHRIPNYFVDRNAHHNQAEIDNVGHLAECMDPDEALVIFPEGTRFSSAKLRRAVAILRDVAPERLEEVSQLRHLLPIRTPGVLAILRCNTRADLVFLNHVVVTDFSSLVDLWRNTPLPSGLHFRVERIKRDRVPPVDQVDDLVRYLDRCWVGLDGWVADQGLGP